MNLNRLMKYIFKILPIIACNGPRVLISRKTRTRTACEECYPNNCKIGYTTNIFDQPHTVVRIIRYAKSIHWIHFSAIIGWHKTCSNSANATYANMNDSFKRKSPNYYFSGKPFLKYKKKLTQCKHSIDSTAD